MNTFLELFLHNKKLTNLVFFAVLLYGFYTLSISRREIMGHLQFDFAQIVTAYPGATQKDVEKSLTNPIEERLRELERIDRIVSTSTEGLSLVTVFFPVDLSPAAKDKKIIEIRGILDNLRDLPRESGRPMLKEFSTDNLPIYEVGLTSESEDREALERTAEALKQRLRYIDRIGYIGVEGSREREIHIQLESQKLLEYQLSLAQVTAAIQLNNVRIGGGTTSAYKDKVDIYTLGNLKDRRDIERLIVRSNLQGRHVRLADLGTVSYQWSPEDIRLRLNGRTGISLIITKSKDADVIRTVDKLKEIVSAFEKDLPEDLDLHHLFDLSSNLKKNLGATATNAAIGFLLLFLTLALFLNFTTAWWTSTGFLFTLAALFALLPAFDLTINMMVLLALIIVVGMLADDSMIIAEHLYTHRKAGLRGIESAKLTLKELLLPVTASISTTIIAFLPYLFVPGAVGSMFRPIPIVITLALLISLFEAFFILTSHLAHSRLRPGKSFQEVLFGFLIQRPYEALVPFVLRHRYLALLGFLGILGTSLWIGYQRLEVVFNPREILENFDIIVETDLGDSLDATTEKVALIEQALLGFDSKYKALRSFTTKIGHHDRDAFGKVGSRRDNWAIIKVHLKEPHAREHSTPFLVARVEELLEPFKTGGMFPLLYLKDQNLGPDFGMSLNVRVIGGTLEERTAVIGDLTTVLENRKGYKYHVTDTHSGKQQIGIVLDEGNLSRFGLTSSHIAHLVRAIYMGDIVTTIREGGESIGVRLLMDRPLRDDYTRLDDAVILNDLGQLIRLKHLISFEPQRGGEDLHHYNGDPCSTVGFELDLDLLNPLLAKKHLLERFAQLREDHPDLQILFEGEIAEQQKLMGSMQIIGLVAILLIYTIMVLLFDSFFIPLLISSIIPFGLVGVIYGFLLKGIPLSMFGMMGIVGLSGIVVNDAIVMIDALRNKLPPGRPVPNLAERLAEVSSTRVRAVVLTTVTTVAGMLPTILEIGGKDFVILPMCLAVGSGLFFATLVTLFFTPALYGAYHDLSCLFRRRIGEPLAEVTGVTFRRMTGGDSARPPSRTNSPLPSDPSPDLEDEDLIDLTEIDPTKSRPARGKHPPTDPPQAIPKDSDRTKLLPKLRR